MAGRGKHKAELQVEIKSQEQWNSLLEKQGLLVVDAYSSWCGACRAIVSLFRRIKNELGDDLLNFATAETDSIESLKFYRGKSKPTFLFYGGGNLVNVIRGCNGPRLERTIRSLLEKEHKLIEGEGEREVFIDPEIQDPIKTEKADETKEELGVTQEEEEEVEVVEVSKEVTVAIIKPDAVREGKADEIIRTMEEAGIQVLHKEERILTKEEAAEFYKQHEGSDHFEQLIEFMSSGPCLTLVLSKEGEIPGYGLIPEFRSLLGPKDVNIAKEEAPGSLRAQFGTDEIQNAIHGCDSNESAARELAFFFPNFNVPKVQEKRKKKQLQRTLALIRPDALKTRKVSIINKIEEAGFVIAMSKEMHLSKEQAEEFYSEHKDQPYFESLVNGMISGPSLALCLAREDAVEVWRNMLGPKDVAVAKEEAPESLRAVFADESSEINQIHGADSAESANREIQRLFPVQSTLAVIKPEAYNEPDQRDLVMSKIQEAGFKISAQKEIVLSKDLASQFYKEHEGKEFFNQLTDYMSSGPTLFMVLSREDAVDGFRALIGPTDPNDAKEISPLSLRAQFAQDSMRNAVHGSSTHEKAKEVISEYFPELKFAPTPEAKVENEEDEKVEGLEAPAEDETAENEGEQKVEEKKDSVQEEGTGNEEGEKIEETEDENMKKESSNEDESANTVENGDSSDVQTTEPADKGDDTLATTEKEDELKGDPASNEGLKEETEGSGHADAQNNGDNNPDPTSEDSKNDMGGENKEANDDLKSKVDSEPPENNAAENQITRTSDEVTNSTNDAPDDDGHVEAKINEETSMPEAPTDETTKDNDETQPKDAETEEKQSEHEMDSSASEAAKPEADVQQNGEVPQTEDTSTQNKSPETESKPPLETVENVPQEDANTAAPSEDNTARANDSACQETDTS